MPTSSTNHRLTQETYRPPPKSLDYMRREEWENPRDSNGSVSRSSFLQRERHLDSGPGRRTAVVVPVGDSSPLATISGAEGDDLKKYKKTKKAAGKSPSSSSLAAKAYSKIFLGGYCCRCHGWCCMRWSFLLFLLGLFLGSLITGLVIGFVLDAKQQAAVEEAIQGLNCIQVPCASGDSNCTGVVNNTIDCTCTALVGEPVSTAPVFADGYVCTLYNSTNTTGTTP